MVVHPDTSESSKTTHPSLLENRMRYHAYILVCPDKEIG
jgi:hypothetical protein